MQTNYSPHADREIPTGQYKSIPHNPNYYIYNDGRVWSIKRNRFLANANHNSGYLFAGGKYNTPGSEKKKMMLVHRLVAQAFIPNPQNLPEVGHKDNNKHNNRITNLYWTTRRENMKAAFADGLMRNFRFDKVGEDNGKAKLTTQDVIEIKQFADLKLLTTRKLAEMYKVSYSCINSILTGRTWWHIQPPIQPA